MAEPFIAEIMLFAGNFPPRGWAFCEGQILLITQNTALFSLLGTTYGGDGRTTFALPDLRGRPPIGPGRGAGLPDYRWGERSGVEERVLVAANLPAHAHQVAPPCDDVDSTTSSPVGANPGADSSGLPTAIYASAPEAAFTMGSSTTSAVGGNQPVPMRDPTLAVSFCIALVGLYPSRS